MVNASLHINYSKWMSARVIGTKYYELTNHLGDVQATILDRLTPNLIGNGPGNEDTVKDYRNDVRTATDYYPFGMIMPERFFEALPDEMDPPPIGGGGIGTGQMKVAQPDSSQLPDNFVPQVGLQVGNWSGLHPNININRLEWMGVGNGLKVHVDSLVYMDDLRDYYAGVDGLIQTLPDTNYDVVLQTDNNNAGYLQAVAYNWSGGTMNILGSVGLPTSGTYTLNFTADLDTTHICIVTGVDTTVDFTVLIASMAKFVTQTVNVPNIVIAVPSKYRFGFNGMEKVDEVAGIGNHLYFGAREYDPRDIRFWSPDPKEDIYPYQGSYLFAHNSPISMTDKDGKHGEIKISKQSAGSGLTQVYIITATTVHVVSNENLNSNSRFGHAYGELESKHNGSIGNNGHPYEGTSNGVRYAATFKTQFIEYETDAQAARVVTTNKHFNSLTFGVKGATGVTGGNKLDWYVADPAIDDATMGHEETHEWGEIGDHSANEYLSGYSGGPHMASDEVNEVLAPAIQLAREVDGSNITIRVFADQDGSGNYAAGKTTYVIYNPSTKEYGASKTINSVNPQPSATPSGSTTTTPTGTRTPATGTGTGTSTGTGTGTSTTEPR